MTSLPPQSCDMAGSSQDNMLLLEEAFIKEICRFVICFVIRDLCSTLIISQMKPSVFATCPLKLFLFTYYWFSITADLRRFPNWEYEHCQEGHDLKPGLLRWFLLLISSSHQTCCRYTLSHNICLRDTAMPAGGKSLNLSVLKVPCDVHYEWIMLCNEEQRLMESVGVSFGRSWKFPAHPVPASPAAWTNGSRRSWWIGTFPIWAEASLLSCSQDWGGKEGRVDKVLIKFSPSLVPCPFPHWL